MDPRVGDASELDQIVAVRHELSEFLRVQEQSVMHFSRPEDSSKAGPGAFFRTTEDRQTNAAPSGSRLTTTVTCIESLLEAPTWQIQSEDATAATLLDRLEKFMGNHLANENVSEVWKSDDAAWVYCRVRTLGSYLRLSAAVTHADYPYRDALRARVEEAWLSRYSGGASFGLREASSDVSVDSFRDQPQPETSDQQYPPNAYLTYWGLLARRGLARASVDLPEDTHPLGGQADKAAREWLVDNLARQVTFHYAHSALADAQQLLWSICGLVRFADGASLENVRSAAHELLVAGLQAFFEQRQPNGDWAIGAPLFHYRNAGNAYSYIYEALGELFALATSGPDQMPPDSAAALRRELRKHWLDIKKLLERARELGQKAEGGAVVWASGHHPHRSAESWATASVFRMLQSLRRLLGMWCSEETKALLGARVPRYGLGELLDRGQTWDTGEGSVGMYLRLAFLWSTERACHAASSAPVDRLFDVDPDQPILASEAQARSAILFGPPGTGKTTMVESLAGALGWDYIEITPARFIDQGMDLVSARADQIFRHLMEVDRCVVLLDEIDELIQLRGAASDPLERFFTTTMLPRLAALWELGKVLFFVNTNDIERVDTAIRRAQRFDAALLVLPPDFATKLGLLAAKHAVTDLPINEKEINDLVLATDHGRGSSAARSTSELSVNLGWFALMRYDQIGTFASAYKAGLEQDPTNPRKAAADALTKIANELLRLDWLPNDADQAQPSADSPGVLPALLGRLLGAVRRDGRRGLVWKRSDGTYEALPAGTGTPTTWASEQSYTIDEQTGELSMTRPTDTVAADGDNAGAS
jgi:hypothetical protein